MVYMVYVNKVPCSFVHINTKYYLILPTQKYTKIFCRYIKSGFIYFIFFSLLDKLGSIVFYHLNQFHVYVYHILLYRFIYVCLYQYRGVIINKNMSQHFRIFPFLSINFQLFSSSFLLVTPKPQLHKSIAKFLIF